MSKYFRKLNIILVLIIIVSSFYQIDTANSMTIDEDWFFSTTYIINLSTNRSGTGFFVKRRISEKWIRIFLVTNKHILDPGPKKLKLKSAVDETDKQQDDFSEYIQISINKEKDGEYLLQKIKIKIRDSSGQDLWFEHPLNLSNDPYFIDVAAIQVGQYLIDNKTKKIKENFRVGFIKEERFLLKSSIEPELITIGDRVVFLGYPLNMVEGKHVIPIARGGTISTPPNQDYQKRPVFIVDSTAVRGSSGSPVFMPMRPYKLNKEETDGQTNYIVKSSEISKPGLLGIVARLIPD